MPQQLTTVRIVAIFVVALILMGLAVGLVEYQSGMQRTINSSGIAYASFLQEALGKMADVSHSKSLKVTAAGFDALASAFQFANETSSVPEQYQRFCVNQAARNGFNHTATITGNMNLSLTYTTSCSNYGVFANDFGKSASLSSDFTKLVFSLMRLDNTISQDP